MPRAVIVGGRECSPASIWYPLMRLLEAGFEVHVLNFEGLEEFQPRGTVDVYDVAVYGECAGETSVRGKLVMHVGGGGDPVEVDPERGVVRVQGPWALYLGMRELLRLAGRLGMLADTPSSPTPREVRELARRLRLDRL